MVKAVGRLGWWSGSSASVEMRAEALSLGVRTCTARRARSVRDRVAATTSYDTSALVAARSRYGSQFEMHEMGSFDYSRSWCGLQAAAAHA